MKLVESNLKISYLPLKGLSWWKENWYCYSERELSKFDEIFLTKAELGKYLKEKCWSEHHLQLSFKYFAKYFFISKLLSKGAWIQTIISKKILSIYRLRVILTDCVSCPAGFWGGRWVTTTSLVDRSHAELVIHVLSQICDGVGRGYNLAAGHRPCIPAADARFNNVVDDMASAIVDRWLPLDGGTVLGHTQNFWYAWSGRCT